MGKRKLFLSNFKGKSFCCVFFIDKDIDDLRRKLLKSNHVFYTKTYDLEGEIYRNTDLHKAVAISLSIDMNHVPLCYHNAVLWVEAKAAHWEQWLTLCAYAGVHKVHCGCDYGRISAINPSLLGDTDVAKYENFKRELQKKDPVPLAKFDKRYLALQRRINRLKSGGELSRLLKGKWLENIISAELQLAFKGKPVDLQAIGPKLSSATASLFDFSSGWAREHIWRLSLLCSRIFEIQDPLIEP
jgi:hypothetical protein